jgi:hypothetical protein
MPATSSVSTSTTTPTAPKTPDYAAIHKHLGASSLLKGAITTIPMLTGNENYMNWLCKLTNVMKYCSIRGILLSEWTEPEVTAGDVDAKSNTRHWQALNAWVTMHVNLSKAIFSQVQHCTMSNKMWLELKKRFMPTSTTSLTLHFLSILHAQ